MKNVIDNKPPSVTNQTVGIERSETKKLNMSTLDEVVGYSYDIFFDVILTISFEFSLRLALP